MVVVNPSQSATFQIEQCYGYADVYPGTDVKYPTCFFAPYIKWEINDEKTEKKINLILCEE
jgi:hypothetical protein